MYPGLVVVVTELLDTTERSNAELNLISEIEYRFGNIAAVAPV